MKKIKILLSFLLIMSMVCGLAVTTTAAGEDVTLAIYKEGTLLGENESIKKGDTITVRLTSNIEASAFSVSARVWYDKSAFTVDSTASKISDSVTSVFKSSARIDAPTSVNNPTTEEQAKLDSGMLPVNITVVAGESDVTLPKGDWADLVFTATNAIDAAQFQIQLRAVDSETAGADISANYTAGAIQVKVEDPIIHVELVELNRKTATIKSPGKTMNIKVKTISPDNATDKTVVWASDNEAVVTISPNGVNAAVMTAVSPGTANVTATVDGVTATCPVTVQNQLYDIYFEPNTATGFAGSTMTLIPKILPENPDGLKLTWKSGDESIATVDESGVVSLLSAGKTTITVTAEDSYNNNLSNALTLTVLAKPKGDGVYTVKMPEDVASEKGETVSLPIVIGTNDSEITTFNTVDMVFDYNPDLLTLSSTTIEGFEVKDEEGSVRIQGYGENRALGTAFTLQFEVKGDETATVTCTQAKVDVSENAVTENAGNAEILDAETVINILKTYSVTLPDGMSSEQGATVSAGKSYTFKVADYNEHYNYTVTATAGEESVEVTDKGDGNYEIASVNSDITVSMTKEGKSASVTLTGQDITGAETAVYGTDYPFTVAKEEGFTYTVKATIAGQPYTLAEPDADGKYTIPGNAITGPIEITVTKEAVVNPDEFDVIFEGTGKADVIDPPAKAAKGQDFVFTINKAEGYEYTVTYAVGGTDETALTGAADNSYTIPGEKVTGYLLITVSKVKVHTVQFTGKNAGSVLEPVLAVADGEDYTFTVYQRAVYKWTVSASVGGGEATVLSPDNDYASGANNGRINYTVKNVTDDLTIEITSTVDASTMNIEVNPYVESDAATVFLIMVQPKTSGIVVDNYNGMNMFDGSNKYKSYFTEKYSCSNSVYVIPVFVDKGETLTVEDVLPLMVYGNQREATLTKTNDVNISQIVDINDAQLVYDIYNGKHTDFSRVSMLKFLNADVNCDMTVNVTDAAAVVNAIP